MRGDCSANWPNSEVAVGVQFEENSREEEVGVLCDGAVNGGSGSVQNMACERCQCFLKMTRTEMMQYKHLSLVRPRVTRTRKNLRVQACEVSVLFAPPVAYKGIAISCKRNPCKKLILSFFEVHHVCDTFPSVEDEACEDQEGDLVNVFHPHCVHFAFCRSSKKKVEFDDSEEWRLCLTVMPVIAKTQFSSRLADCLHSCPLGLTSLAVVRRLPLIFVS